MNSKNVTAAKPKKGGAIFRAPVGTTLPTDSAADLNAAFVALGYISEDGMTNANSPTSDKVRAWGGDTVLNSQTDKEDTFKFTLIEATNVEVLKTIYGDSNVTGTLAAGITVMAGNEDQPEYAWVVDMVLKDGTAKRIVVPQAKITEVGEISYADNKAVGYATTISATYDTAGYSHYEYIRAAQ